MALTNAEDITIRKAAKARGYEYAALRAFVEVEANGETYVMVNGKQLPVIRYEGHYFDKLVPPARQAAARKAGLASPKVKGIPNPKSQADRYKLLDRAKAFDYNAAVSSTSYGIGQVMGDNWRLFGMDDAAEFERLALSGFEGQLELVLRFLDAKKLKKALNARDWSTVARIYNGPRYAENNYDTRLAAAYAKFSNTATSSTSAPSNAGMLRPGSKGPEVYELQRLLLRAKFNPGKIDGDFGNSTWEAVKDFQRNYNINPIDGVAGPKTLTALNDFKSAEEVLNKVTVSNVSEVKQSAVPLVGIGTVVAVKDSLTELATNVSSVSLETATTVANYLTAGASLIGVGLAIYAAYGWFKANRNVRGIEDKVTFDA